VAAQAEPGIGANDVRRRRAADAAGASYLIGLHKIADQDPSTVGAIGMVLLFNVIMLALLELPLIGFLLAPEWTPRAVDRFKAWFSRNARGLAFRVALLIGALLIVRGLIYLL
jgi:hypothetical protein